MSAPLRESAIPPPEPPFRAGRAGRFAALATALVALTAVPVVALVVPNTVSYVIPQVLQDLGLTAAQVAGLVRVNGLALPTLLLAVPLSAVAAWRLPAWTVLLTGLLCVLGGQLAAEFAPSVPAIGAVRVAQGIGAGMVLPATLVLVWERGSRVLTAVWAGAFTGALILTMPLALHAVPAQAAPSGGDWRAVLQPYPWLLGVALAAAALLVTVRLWARTDTLPILRRTERTQLMLPFVPAAGFAFLAIVTTYGWSSGAQLIVAGLGLAALLGLAVVGTRSGVGGSPLGFPVVALTAGLLTVPMTAPLVGLISTQYGPHGVPVPPFAAGAAAALAGALGTAWLRGESARAAVLCGHGLIVIAILILLTTSAASRQWLLALPLAVLGAGIGTAFAVSLRAGGLGPALFGLSLCFPAVLAGYLIVGPLQIAGVHDAIRLGARQQDVVYGLTAAFRIWLVVAGVITVLMAGAAALAGRPAVRMARRRTTGLTSMPDGMT